MAKNYSLLRDADKDKVYGALREVTKNPKLWHSSSVGKEYCHYTPEGKEAILDMLEGLLRDIDHLDRKVLDQQARQTVWDELKAPQD